ncbi:unnamed protein product [Prorocentrum cordatum]|uniref:Cellulase n=1 Tax=Prorocentrum cordatum TaxID=2364126 RepID=A0ABN9SXA8_9DINO|nr:unnamed protein product [Polarella glacialis]
MTVATNVHDDRGSGSEEAPQSGSKPFDCHAGFSNWEAGWSADKKSWCCDHEHKGCSGTSEPYDCEAGFNNWQAGWSGDKKRWCCSKEREGVHDHHVPALRLLRRLQELGGWLVQEQKGLVLREKACASDGAQELLEQLSAGEEPSRLFLEPSDPDARPGRPALGRQVRDDEDGQALDAVEFGPQFFFLHLGPSGCPVSGTKS